MTGLALEAARDWGDVPAEGLPATAGALPTLAVLGAGNCNDLDLPALTGAYREIHLLDLDREAIAAARARQPEAVAERLVLHGPVDLGGSLRRLAAMKRRAVLPAELGALPRQAMAEALASVTVRADVVLSACLLSQIVHTCHRVLGSAHPQLEAVACALVVAHLRALAQLVRPGGVAILATDTVSSETYPLEEMWGERSAQALLEELEASNNYLSGTIPTFLRRILRTDEVIAPLYPAPPRLAEPWLWRLTPDKTLLAYALTFRRRGPERAG